MITDKLGEALLFRTSKLAIKTIREPDSDTTLSREKTDAENATQESSASVNSKQKIFGDGSVFTTPRRSLRLVGKHFTYTASKAMRSQSKNRVEKTKREDLPPARWTSRKRSRSSETSTQFGKDNSQVGQDLVSNLNNHTYFTRANAASKRKAQNAIYDAARLTGEPSTAFEKRFGLHLFDDEPKLFPFFQLPGEVRNMIYKHVVVEINEIPIGKGQGPYEPAICRVNKQSRQESRGLYYQLNVFNFTPNNTELHSFFDWAHSCSAWKDFVMSVRFSARQYIFWENVVAHVRLYWEDTRYLFAKNQITNNPKTYSEMVTGEVLQNTVAIAVAMRGQPWETVETVLRMMGKTVHCLQPTWN